MLGTPVRQPDIRLQSAAGREDEQLTDTETPGPDPATEPLDPVPQALRPSRARGGGLSASGRRILFILLGLLILLGSVAGFYFTSDAFDDRTDVLVTAVDIAPGAVVSAPDFEAASAVMGDIPHIPWTPDAPLAFDGWVAVEAVAAGSVVTPEMFIFPETTPVDDQLEVILPLDLSYSVTPVQAGDTVLLIDPGVVPTVGDLGRPRRVIRALELNDFDGESVRLLVPPEEWTEWRALPEILGASPQVLPVSLGGDPEDVARRLDTIWTAAYLAGVAAVTPEIIEEPPEPAPGPGELEVRVPLDDRLAPTGLNVGDLVLLVDAGERPAGSAAGRPRSVIGQLELDLFDGDEVRLFAEPDEWTRWSALPETLGGAPLAIPVPDGSDPEEMTERLDALWLAEWEAQIEEWESAATEVATPQPGEFLVTLPLDASISSRPPNNGDQVLILDPGAPGLTDDGGRPPQVIEWRVLEGWDGSVLRFWADADRWAFYTFLPERLDATPMVMVVTEPVTEDAVEDLLRDVNLALLRWFPSEPAEG